MNETVTLLSFCILTSETLTWDTTTTLFEEQEAAMIDYSGRVVTTTRRLIGHVNHLVINSR